MGSAPAPRKMKGTPLPVIKESEQKSEEFENVRRARIARRAHQLFEQDGAGHGRDVAHWLQAEAELVAAISDLWESGSWITANAALPNDMVPETIQVLVRSDRGVVCVEARRAAAEDFYEGDGGRRVMYLEARWPKEVDPATSNAYLKDGVVTLSAKHAPAGTASPNSSTSQA